MGKLNNHTENHRNNFLQSIYNTIYDEEIMSGVSKKNANKKAKRAVSDIKKDWRNFLNVQKQGKKGLKFSFRSFSVGTLFGLSLPIIFSQLIMEFGLLIHLTENVYGYSIFAFGVGIIWGILGTLRECFSLVLGSLLGSFSILILANLFLTLNLVNNLAYPSWVEILNLVNILFFAFIFATSSLLLASIVEN